LHLVHERRVLQYFDKKGNLKEVYKLNETGQVEGVYKSYYPSGARSYECEYDDGKKEGDYRGGILPEN
jgi:antitoxin component YwqK of YwqJK toxin-antitoxin module